MKTVVLLALVLGVVTADQLPLTFTVYGVVNPASVVLQHPANIINPLPNAIEELQTRYVPSPVYTRLSGLPLVNIYRAPNYQPSVYLGNPIAPSHLGAYSALLSPPAYSSPHNLRYGSHLNLLTQLYAPPLNQNRVVTRIYSGLDNIRNGPVTILVRSQEDPNKLVAVYVERGLESLIHNQGETAALREALKAGEGIKTAFLFSPANTPASSLNLPITRYVIPEGMNLAQIAYMAVRSPNTPFLLLADENTPWASAIKTTSQTYEIGQVEVSEQNVSIIPRFPVQPVLVPMKAGNPMINPQIPGASVAPSTQSEKTNEAPPQAASPQATWI
ncbi:uncharacterized protein [Periplaneta americana]|uniref:uncharacterized protein n=1 Tax=Periplaneta americana TaxID=6978 RepID=UPI0037E775DA